MDTDGVLTVQDVIDQLCDLEPGERGLVVGVLSDDESSVYPVRFIERRTALVPGDYTNKIVIVFRPST